MESFFYIIKKFKLATVLNLLGLATAFTACYVLWTQVDFARNYNKCIPEWENVYRLEVTGLFGDETMVNAPRPLAERLAEMPEVEDVFFGQLDGMSLGYEIEDGKKLSEKDAMIVKMDVATIFDQGLRMARPKMLCGTDTLEKMYDMLIPRSFAQKYFGEAMVAGRDIDVDGLKLHISGVFEDFPENCTFPNNLYLHYGDEGKDVMNNWNYQTFLRLRPGCDKKNIEERAHKIVVDFYIQQLAMTEDATDEVKKKVEERNSRLKFSLRNCSETYFSGINETYDRGNKGMDLVLRLAVLFLLAVATINFANFTLAETPMRIKGINTRKVLGMTNLQLRRDFILETVLVSLSAFALSVFLIWLVSLAPWMLGLVKGSIAIQDNLYLIIYLGAAALAIGLLVGLYPAFYATSFPPALVLKGSFGLSPRGILLRKTLVCVQLVVAFFLTIYLGVLFLQSNFIFHSDYGFAKDEIMYCPSVSPKENFEKTRQLLQQIPGVESVGFTTHMPGINNYAMKWGRGEGDKELTVTVLPVDWNFLPTLGIDIVEGRNFTEHDNDCFVVNEIAKKKYGWIEMDKPLTDGECPVIGVCKDFRVFSTKYDNRNEPVVMIVFGEKYKAWGMSYTAIVRVGKNVDKIEAKKHLEAALEPFILEPEFKFLDDELQQTYEEEFRFIRQVEAFSLICLIVTLVGAFCLTLFETQYRRKEIGLRRVLGSSSADIIRMFCRRYVLLLLPAFAIAAPLSWRMGHDWLQNFAERTSIPWWLFPLALLLISAVVLATIALQTWRAARENPVESLKTE